MRSGWGGQSDTSLSGPMAANETPDRYSISSIRLILTRPLLVAAFKR